MKLDISEIQTIQPNTTPSNINRYIYQRDLQIELPN